MVSREPDQYLNKSRQFKKHLTALLPILSLLVVLGVFWWLKLVGITLAGEAFCGKDEHSHGEACLVIAAETDEESTAEEDAYSCGLEAHIHTADCYSDLQADLETAADWEATLPEMTGDMERPKRVLAVATSQLGYEESQRNFEVDAQGVRRGYTRYGTWFGNPYGDWSNMFTAFCLRYGGLDNLPVSAGADAMRLQWQELGRYAEAMEYAPVPGDVVFLDKNANGTPDATAIVTACSNGIISVIEGDLNNQVAETIYELAGGTVCGYGIVEPRALLSTMNANTGKTAIARTVAYDKSLFTETNSFVLYVAGSGGYYAIDDNANAVQIEIDASGNIFAEIDDPNLLLWSFTYSSTDSYLIRNSSTGRYMHAYPNNGTGVTTGGAYPSTLLAQSNGTVKIRSNSEYARLVESAGNFQMTQNQSQAAGYRFGLMSRCTVWLDGTHGGLMGLGGSLDKSYMVEAGSTITLPEDWQSPAKYHYQIRGWMDIKNNRYYLPGAEVTVTENLVFYPDWVAANLDVGQYNTQVADTVSTNDFITTRVFDYNALFNLYSLTSSISATASGHSESWSLVANGTVPYKNQETLGFIFADYDSTGDISYPRNQNSANISGGIYPDLYTERLGSMLFDPENEYDPATGEGVVGKRYLGTADHLFQIDHNPESENYGYHYYDSRLNAASYNQSDRRFYVYDYLERTADSSKDGGVGEYSDFLPLNSPYANTNGNTVVQYNYNGENGEYAGVTHYQYDAKYNTNNNSTENVTTNYWFGMSLEMEFYLPDRPGVTDADGEYGNRDLYGQQMHFKFSGDDDVWVFVDGQLVLDIGGVHGVENGDINFSSGAVVVNGTQVSTLSGVKAGGHTLTIYYLERGSSQSNCAIYFNLAPRFALTLQKEDVLTQSLLDGAEFSVYMDADCTIPAELWESSAAYKNDLPATHTFTVKDGTAEIWGLITGKIYYIRETKPPDKEAFSRAYGIICLALDKRGESSYSVEILPEIDENGNEIAPSGGFTVYGFWINEETQEAYISVTNAHEWVEDTTTVQAHKVWGDALDHSGDSVTVYLTVTYPDGTVTRIRKEQLSAKNNWQYSWNNLPKYAEDGVTEITYGIEEAYVPGYSPTIEQVKTIETTTVKWDNVTAFEDGQVYLLTTNSGALATVSATSGNLRWVEVETAKTLPDALWTAKVSSGKVKFTNGNGQILNFNYGNSSNNRYFNATTSQGSYQELTPVKNGAGFRLYCTRSNRSYYIGTLNTNGRATATTTASSGQTFTLMTRVTETTRQEAEGLAFRVTNEPLEQETSLKVTKVWDLGMATGVAYEQSQVTVKLLSNGKDTGRTVTLNLKNGWQDTFWGLPYADAKGVPFTYTVEETWENKDWISSYGKVTLLPGTVPTYEVTVTNTYRLGYGYEMPVTGGAGKTLWVLIGLALMAGALVCGFLLRRKERRSEPDDSSG